MLVYLSHSSLRVCRVTLRSRSSNFSLCLVQCNRGSIRLRVQHAKCNVVRWPRIAVHEARYLLCLKLYSANPPPLLSTLRSATGLWPLGDSCLIRVQPITAVVRYVGAHVGYRRSCPFISQREHNDLIKWLAPLLDDHLPTAFHRIGSYANACQAYGPTRNPLATSSVDN